MFDTTSTTIIYILRVLNSETHKGLLKIGKSSGTNIDLKTQPNDDKLNEIAKQRIKNYVGTSGLEFELLHTEIAQNFKSDKDIHKILKNSEIHPLPLSSSKEWFKCSLEDALQAITAAKRGYSSINTTISNIKEEPIVLREEQRNAVDKTKKIFLKNNKLRNEQNFFLWNAKMRFGKTITALTLIKEIEEFKKILIITHRPILKSSWKEEFNKVFLNKNKYGYFTKNSFNQKEWELKNTKIYFASIQDLRESKDVGGKYEKNEFIFKEKWDFLIIDEAHEGTQTSIGKNLIKKILNYSTNIKVLFLSGTPFNLLNDNINSIYKLESNEIFTWSYVDEQREKENWDKKHFGDSNPYENLPKMNILTVDLTKILNLSSKFVEIEDKAFSFKEFFRTWTGEIEKDNNKKIPDSKINSFMYEKEVYKFLDLLSSDGVHKYPLMNLQQHHIY
ncbi:DEAD/DEAH box helicase family protein [Mesomycoplasma neurolyticum]|uniref:Helicase ATP-binding domain-containing protein n=1 Tax=Mesomycoplasma neurolyticum TaxID=2120 RepID=A0A449A5L5_9BACT|nr:DEAD/DEAH box helicase family protein [Mesomycoplasma neurolyticum]VEU59528.1 Uncharacterised protein [Mesomycoplasma neurolyticum]